MKSTHRRWNLWAACLGMLAALPGHAQTASQPPLRLGVIVAATGPAALLGNAARSGALLAQKQINASGGVNGREVQLLVRDDATNPDTALTHANELVRGQKVDMMLTLTTTASAIAVGGITHPVPMPQISLSGIGAPIERERKCVVHLAPSQDVNARAFLGYAKLAGLKKMAVFYDTGWGTLVYGELKRHAANYGIELVAAEKYEQAATDTTTQAAKIKAAQPDTVAVIGNSPVPYRDLRRLLVMQPIIGAATAASYEAVNAMGVAADNIVMPEYMVSESPTPRQKPFVDMYQKEYNALPKGPAMIGWDAVHIAAELARRAGPGASGEKLCGAIRDKFAGVSYAYDFAADDLNGLKPSQIVFSRLVKGKFEPMNVQIAD